MMLLLNLLAVLGLLAWTAGPTEQPHGEAAARPAGETVTSGSVTTAPAGSRNEVGGPRKKKSEGSARQEGGSVGARRRAERKPSAPVSDDPLPAAEVEELMHFARANFPQLHQRLEKLRQVKPGEFNRMLRRDQRLAQKMVDEYRLQMVITSLSRRCRQAKTEQERARLRAELQARIGERFDRHQERIRMEIQHLRARLDEQERRLADREKRKEELLRQEYERVLRGASNPAAERQSGKRGLETND
jgi:hypothetical protein